MYKHSVAASSLLNWLVAYKENITISPSEPEFKLGLVFTVLEDCVPYPTTEDYFNYLEDQDLSITTDNILKILNQIFTSVNHQSSEVTNCDVIWETYNITELQHSKIILRCWFVDLTYYEQINDTQDLILAIIERADKHGICCVSIIDLTKDTAMQADEIKIIFGTGITQNIHYETCFQIIYFTLNSTEDLCNQNIKSTIEESLKQFIKIYKTTYKEKI